MPELNQSQNDIVTQFQLNGFINNLSGLTKIATKKILNSGFADEMRKTLNNFGAENANNAVKTLIKTSANKTINGITRKFTIVLVTIISIIAVIAIIITLIAGGNIVVPIAILAALIVIIWIVTKLVTNGIAQKVSDVIFKAIEGKINQFSGIQT